MRLSEVVVERDSFDAGDVSCGLRDVDDLVGGVVVPDGVLILWAWTGGLGVE